MRARVMQQRAERQYHCPCRQSAKPIAEFSAQPAEPSPGSLITEDELFDATIEFMRGVFLVFRVIGMI